MESTTPPQVLERLTRIWSDRQERLVAVRIYYRLEEHDDSKLYTLEDVEELA